MAITGDTFSSRQINYSTQIFCMLHFKIQREVRRRKTNKSIWLKLNYEWENVERVKGIKECWRCSVDLHPHLSEIQKHYVTMKLWGLQHNGLFWDGSSCLLTKRNVRKPHVSFLLIRTVLIAQFIVTRTHEKNDAKPEKGYETAASWKQFLWWKRNDKNMNFGTEKLQTFTSQ